MLGSIGKIEYRGSADDAQSTGRLIADQAPDVLIVDQDIAETLVKDKDISPWPRLLVLSRRSHIGTEVTFKAGGVCGSIAERATAHVIENALRTISDCKSSSNETECRGCPLQKSMALP
jgi:DNA-binding NarL/FixJ family response regulator